MSLKFVVINICLWLSVTGFSLDTIKTIFGNQNCVPGSLLELKFENSQHVVPKEDTSTIDIATSNTQDKSPLSLINELADYNDISYSYELIDEKGPAHSKIFTIALHLGDEYYEAEESSHKKCQRAAAMNALKHTKYNHPPLKLRKNENTLTPTVLLNNLATKLGLTVTYSVVDDILESLESMSNHQNIDYSIKKSYVDRLNDTLHSNDSIRIRKDTSEPLQGPFKVKVEVNDEKFFGEAQNIQSAKHEAALKALKSLNEKKDTFKCIKEDGCKKQRKANNSPISQVYEEAQLRNLDVSFEIIDETGPSHRKEFTMSCKIGTSLQSTGVSSSKKKAKKLAAENILPQLLELPLSKEIKQHKGKKSKKSKKKKKIIKSTFDKVDIMLDNMMEYGKNLYDKVTGNDVTNNKMKPKRKQDYKTTRSAGDEIIKLGNLLHLHVQFNDYLLNDKHYAILDLGTKPAFICLGEGITRKNSRDLAATYGINVLNKLGLFDRFDSKTTTKISDALEENGIYPELLDLLENLETKKKHPKEEL